MTAGEGPAHGPDDREIVDLVEAALVDPNVRTDTRMRLHRELGELLHRAHTDLRGGEAPAPEPSSHLPSVLEDVLVDPDLHTDARLRLHREIQEILRRHNQSRA